MSATVIVGGQYGSEGKGKIAAYLAPRFQHSVRTGGPNAGHTVRSGSKAIVLRHLPCAVVAPEVKLYLGAGAVIDPAILVQEIANNEVGPGRLFIDRQAAIISEAHLASEVALVARIGSTGKGVGAAVAAKVLREPALQLARDIGALKPYLAGVSGLLGAALKGGESVLIEGTQGIGLSLHHGHFPHVTSRDVTAGSLCGEIGVGPTQVSSVIMVVRTYPIRVAGPSGPLEHEIDWQTVTAESGYAEPLVELTTVTQKVRRVARFDLQAVRRAAELTSASEIALTFADYLDASALNCREFDFLPKKIKEFVEQLEQGTGVPVSLIGTGADTASIIER
jgi:adenylosuccinate synthase